MKTKHLPLIVGVSLPIIFIIIISVVISVPSLFIKPQHNFVYTNEDSYYAYQEYQNIYRVENGHIALEPVPPRGNIAQTKIAPTLYLYDVEANSSHQLTLEEARDYSIDPGPSSPDGYTVAYQYGHDGIFELFGSDNDNNGYFISKGNGKKKLNGLTGDRYYYNSGDFRLIGWIK